MWSKWFGGGKKKPTLEEKWAKELVELKLRGYVNTKRNTELLEMYQGNEDLVIQQLDIDSPKAKMPSADALASAAASVLPPKPKLLEPKPVAKAPVATKPEPVPTVEDKPIQMDDASLFADTEEVADSSNVMKSAANASESVKTTEMATVSSERKKPAAFEESVDSSLGSSTVIVSKTDAVSETIKSETKSSDATKPKTEEPSTDAAVITPKPAVLGANGAGLPPPEIIKFSNNLKGLRSHQIRGLLLAIGESKMSELTYTHSIDGDAIYDFEQVNGHLSKHGVGFSEMHDFATLLKQLETVHEKRLSKKPKAESASVAPVFAEVSATSEESKASEPRPLKEMISNEVRKAVAALGARNFKEMADRLYTHSVNGAHLDTLDYAAAIAVSGMDASKFSAKDWAVVVSNLALSQSAPLRTDDAKKVQSDAVVTKSEALAQEIERTEVDATQTAMDSQLHEMSQRVEVLEKATKAESSEQKSAESRKKAVKSSGAGDDRKAAEALRQRQDRILREVQQLQDEVDSMSLTPQMLELKKTQLSAVQSLSALFTANVFGSQPAADKALAKAKEKAFADSVKDLAAFKEGKVVGAPVSTAVVNERLDKVIAQMQGTLQDLEQFAHSQGIQVEAFS